MTSDVDSTIGSVVWGPTSVGTGSSIDASVMSLGTSPGTASSAGTSRTASVYSNGSSSPCG